MSDWSIEQILLYHRSYSRPLNEFFFFSTEFGPWPQTSV